ncbi:MAG: YlmH/Sll1252 family protein, partial [Eubacterium aggregans]
LGDIHVVENEVQIIFAARMKPFFKQNLNKMKGRSITVEYRGPEEIRSYALQFKSLDLVVSSLRVDGIIGKIW